MNTKAIIPLVLGLCVGLVAVKYLVDTLKKARGSTAAPTSTFVRTTQDIDSFQKITPELLELVETTDVSLIPSNERITSIDEVKDRVAAKDIPQNSLIVLSMLAPEGTEAGMKGQIPPGYRAVSVKIDEVTGVAYQLKPGDWVDVIVVMSVDTGRRKKETVAEVILQHVEVLAIGQTTTGPTGETGKSKAKPAKSATLLVPEDDAPKLHLAATRGRVTLAMRGADSLTTEVPAVARESEDFYNPTAASSEEETASTDSGTSSGPAGFLGTFVAFAATPPQTVPEPEPEPEPPHGLTIYRGLPNVGEPKVEQVVFANGASRTVVGVSSGPVARAVASKDNRAERKPRPQRRSDQTEPVKPDEPDTDFDYQPEEVE